MKPKRIGFTTSMPVEVLYAAGHIPIDLNNIFLTQDAEKHVRMAEVKGFPRTICTWIKGNYNAAVSSSLDEVLGVVQGDCSNGHSLLDMINEEDIPVYRFSFPPEKSYAAMDAEISRLEQHYGATRSDTLKTKARLDSIRKKLLVLDEWTWKERIVSGKENHFWLVNSSDFNGNPDKYEEELDSFMREAKQRDPKPARLRLAYLGVPPIFKNIYDAISELGGDVVFNEVQRQFSMPTLLPDVVKQYLEYTYPYSVYDRLRDIKTQLKERSIEAVISYTQSFCHLQIDNLLLKKYIDLPFLNLEGDQPEDIDSRTQLRLESFFEVHA
ncbi:MAG: 2-hydroxyglutaryl-CoA dehydratase [Candidatus Cloacimonetes bacterium HGW-Cloacimonetes-3]|jgi:benzoyl-CoA reductase/2-hydroxyglutaryl-CoA dehydratase subunit BcrC/BadD/HgdB|nr:MAG: 2-hydroxyglutaryl-CoA dehydratase [Candidatus Cloacimonetes bacterium HGW-Cloacimonetes-3]